ncbi:MAG: sigma-70 family RNA polymerase sigma factor [Myxococcales bacterium]
MDIGDAFSLLRQHRSLTARLVRRVGRGEAEDLASEAVARGVRRPAPDGRQAPWIEHIFRNLAIDRGRRLRREAVGLLYLTGCSSSVDDSPEDLLLARERQGVVRDALRRLPPRLLDALVARYFEEHDYHGIAASRGITASTARTRVHRALAHLRVSLARLRLVVHSPLLSGTHSVLVAVMPALFTAALVIPTLAADQKEGSGSAPAASRSILLVQARPLITKAESHVQTTPPSVAAPPSRPAPMVDASAVAAPSVSGTTRHAPASTSAPAVQRFQYDDDDLVGDLRRPMIEALRGAPALAHYLSLIEIPRSFEPALTKMLEDL